MTARTVAACCLAFATTLLATATSFGTTHQVGPGERFSRPSQAIAVAASGDVIEIASGTYTGDVALIRTPNLTIRGVGKTRPKLVAAGKSVGDKAIWVTVGDNITIENIEFVGARVKARNGAGIRIEGENLTIRGCRFFDCENGILGGFGPLTVEYCEFVKCGLIAEPATHSLYISQTCTQLTFQYNYSTETVEGHLLKSRAATNLIRYNRIADENGTGSAVIDLPNGGYAVIVGNVLHKGPRAQNTRVIAYGMEGVKHERNGLVVAYNTMVFESRHKGPAFVDAQDVPANFKATIVNNLCVGPVPLTNIRNADGGGNVMLQSVGQARFVNPAEWDYRLEQNSPAVGRAANLPKIKGLDLIPKMQYVHRTNSVERPDANDVGAFSLNSAPKKKKKKDAKDAEE